MKKEAMLYERVEGDKVRCVYLGNVSADTHTYCHRCNEVVITQDGGESKGINLKNGKCPSCGAEFDGVWE